LPFLSILLEKTTKSLINSAEDGMLQLSSLTCLDVIVNEVPQFISASISDILKAVNAESKNISKNMSVQVND
jgi:hypothetical protein